ncbi:NADH-quinone oxidoreductase subunit C [Bdellovibrionota bacterium]
MADRIARMNQEELLKFICNFDPQAKISEKNCSPKAVEIPASNLVSFMTKLRDESTLAFDQLTSHTAVDWVEKNQFELVYILKSLKHNYSLMVLVSIPRDNPVIPTLSSVWRIAEFQEREVYDLFGVLYDEHPDLRRLFLEDEWEGFPLRKDYKDDFILEIEQ